MHFCFTAIQTLIFYYILAAETSRMPQKSPAKSKKLSAGLALPCCGPSLSSDSSLTDGTLLPGFRLPFAISILNRSMICRYMGVSLLKFHSIISPVFVLLYYLINTIIHVRLFVNYKLISYKNVRYEVEM